MNLQALNAHDPRRPPSHMGPTLFYESSLYFLYKPMKSNLRYAGYPQEHFGPLALTSLGVGHQEDREGAKVAQERKVHTTCVSQIRGTILEVPIKRILVFGGLYWGPPVGLCPRVFSLGRFIGIVSG